MENREPLRDALIEPGAFLVAEFAALRREIELEIKEIGDFLRYAILSSGAIWLGSYRDRTRDYTTSVVLCHWFLPRFFSVTRSLYGQRFSE